MPQVFLTMLAFDYIENAKHFPKRNVNTKVVFLLYNKEEKFSTAVRKA